MVTCRYVIDRGVDTCSTEYAIKWAEMNKLIILKFIKTCSVMKIFNNGL